MSSQSRSGADAYREEVRTMMRSVVHEPSAETGPETGPTCQFCAGPIDPDRDWRRVIGWERHRTQGGTNMVALREPMPQWACRGCIDLRRSGISPDQVTLW